jgi:hypothetical protein
MAVDKSSYQIHIGTTADTAAIKEAADKFTLFGRGAHEAHAALRTLGEAIPGVGHLARDMVSPAMLGIGILGVGFSEFKSHLNDVSAALDELGKAEKPSTELTDKLRESVDKAIVSMAVWEHQIERTLAAHQKLSEKFQESIEREKVSIASQTEVAKAQEELAKAKLELAEKLGLVTPEQAVKIKIEIDDAAFKEQVEAKSRELAAELSARLKEFSGVNAQEPELTGRVAKTGAAAESAEQAKIKHDQKLKDDQKALADSQARQAKAEEDLAKEEASPFGMNSIIEALKNTIETEGRQQGNLKAFISQAQAGQARIDAAAEITKADFEASKKDYEEAAKLSHDLEAQLTRLQGDLEAAKAQAGALEGIHAQTSAIRGMGPGDIADQQARGAAAGERGPQAGLDASQAVADARNIEANLRGRHGSPDEMAEVHKLHQRIIGFLENQVSPAIQSQHQQLEDSTRRLANLELQVQVARDM